MSRYRLLDRPDFNPGKCAVCGSSQAQGRKYIDFGVEVPLYGTVYLCTFCVEDLAATMDLFEKYEHRALEAEHTVKEFEELRALAEALNDTVAALSDEVKDLYARLSAFRDAGADNYTASDLSPETALEPSGDSTVPNNPEGDGKSERQNASGIEGSTPVVDPTPEKSESESSKPKPRATKSTSSSGRQHVSSLEELLRNPGSK